MSNKYRIECSPLRISTTVRIPKSIEDRVKGYI